MLVSHYFTHDLQYVLTIQCQTSLEATGNLLPLQRIYNFILCLNLTVHMPNCSIFDWLYVLVLLNCFCGIQGPHCWFREYNFKDFEWHYVSITSKIYLVCYVHTVLTSACLQWSKYYGFHIVNLKLSDIYWFKALSCCSCSSGQGSSSSLTSLTDLPLFGKLCPYHSFCIDLHCPKVVGLTSPTTGLSLGRALSLEGVLCHSIYSFSLTSASFASPCHLFVFFI